MKSLKIKMTSMVLATVIAFSVMIVGVLAVTNVSLNLGGTINFIVVPTDVYLNSVTLKNTVTQSSNGYQTNDITLSEYSNIYIRENDSIELSNVQVLAGQTMEIDIAMTSLNENYLKVNLTYNNLPSTVTINSTSLYMPQNTTGDLADGQERTYKIYISNSGSGTLDLSSINLNVSFEEKTSLLQQGVSEYTGENMWYVEMGTIPTATGNEYVKWRYFSDGETHYDFSSTAPTGRGYFIMETYTSVISASYNNNYRKSSSGSFCNQNGWDNIDACNYVTSNVRQYINGNTVFKSAKYSSSTGTYSPSGLQSNMYRDLNIDINNDLIFNKIIGRTLSDLDVFYITFAENATVVFTENDVDKFWLLSYTEAGRLLSTSYYGDSSDYLARSWGSYYTLRTSSKGAEGEIYYSESNGDMDYVTTPNASGCRPSFQFII